MIKDLKEFCHLFYTSTFVPISVYEVHAKELFAFPTIFGREEDVTSALSSMIRFHRNPDYYTMQSLCYFGIVYLLDTDQYVLIGPVFSVPVTESAVRLFMKDCAIPMKHKNAITGFLLNTPQVSFNQFLQIIAYIHLCLNDEKLDIPRHFDLADRTVPKEISVLHSNNIYEAKEEQKFHNTYLFEQQFLECVSDGNMDKLTKLMKAAEFSLNAGIIGDTPLRNAKNLLVTTVTLTTRAAISGGMDIEQAYQLSDVYIQEGEKMQSIDALNHLQYTMITDFTERVAQSKIPRGMSREIFKCVRFISQHTNELIRADDVADFIGWSRPYLSRKFKEELGFDISSFIMRCKLEEAKSLLTYTDKSLSEISNYLCFSSQAYFQNVFKKKYGLTPTQYRNQTTKA